MSSNVEKIIEALQNAEGTNFDLAVCDAFRYLGLDSEHIGLDDDAEPDVIAKSKWSGIAFMIVCECHATNERRKVKTRKVGQIRSNGPHHVEEGVNLYLAIVGKPSFGINAIKNSPPDVCLLVAEDLIKLVKHHALLRFRNEELEGIFGKCGEATPRVNELIMTLHKKLKMYAEAISLTICAVEEYSAESQNTPISISNIKAMVRSFGLAWELARFHEIDVMHAISFLASPPLRLLRVNEEYVELSGITSESMKEMKMLGEVGAFILEVAEEIREKLRLSDKRLGDQCDFI